MKTNKEIVTKIIEDLEKNVGLNWPRRDSKVSKERLIECWSQNLIIDYKYFGYKYPSGLLKIYTKLFKNINKNCTSTWKRYILTKYNYKYCSKCNNLYTLNNFTKDKSRIDNISSICKTCNIQYSTVYNKENEEGLKNYKKEYYKNNKDYYLAASKKYKLNKSNRTPKWLTKDDFVKIKEFYTEAKKLELETGIKYHVDHIVPLQGKLVSGLHVPNNLQIITAERNLSKSNSYLIE
jgi:inhibitor of KinA sporulation pathway (predicted exonuclease)